jgi:hypothetical protein
MRSFLVFKAALAGAALCALPTIGLAQVSSINSANINLKVFNDMPAAVATATNNYPTSITLSETGDSRTASGGLNRDIWYNGGTSAYQFQNNDYFKASFGLTLTGGTPGTDLEAGWLFSDPSGSFGGDLQSLLTNAGVVVQFGGPSYFPFSPAAGGYGPPFATTPGGTEGSGGGVANYTEGTTYTMGLNYLLDPFTGNNAFEYSVNGQLADSSAGDPYFDLGPGVGVGSNPLGGYFQIGNALGNSGQAVFSDITITAVPEPTTLSLLGLGCMTLLARRRAARQA